MKNQQSGFTLIELVIVIVILGLLAATALPRFANLTVDARIAARSGVDAAIRSASSIIHAQALIAGTADAAAGGSVTVEDGTVINLDFQYPDETGIIAAVDLTDAVGVNAGGVVTFTVNSNANCTVTYTVPTAATGAGSVPVFGGTATCN